MTRYSKDLRERAIKYLLSGHSYRETAKTFNVGTPALGRERTSQAPGECKPAGYLCLITLATALARRASVIKTPAALAHNLG